MYYIGIDWADQKHDIAMVDDQDNAVLKPFSIQKSRKGFEKLLAVLRSLSENPEDFKIGIETPHNLIVDFLVELDYPVFTIFPGLMKDLRRRYRVSGAHDDPFDAFVLADALRTDKAGWRRVHFGSELAREIRILARDHHTLVAHQVVLFNSLRSALNIYYPEYIHFFKDVWCKTSLAFITAYPDFASAQKLTSDELNQFFKEQHYYNSKTVSKIYDILQQEHLTVARPLLEAKRLKAVILAQRLQQMAADMERYLKRLEKLVDHHPDGELFLSYPAVSYVTAARLIALFGDNRALFADVSELQALAGTCPVTEKSGKSKVTYFRRACNKFHRDVMQQLAFASLKECPWARAYYQRHRARGKKHSHALRCLANIHLKNLFAMWQNRRCYDENVFLAQRARHKLYMVNE